MSDPTPPPDPPATDGELLSAYLADDLDPETAARVEARLRTEPGLAAELDGMADMLAGLQGLSETEPPPGYEQRLRGRIAAERRPATPGRPAAHGRPAAAGSGDATPLESARRRRWPVLTAAAAAVVAVAFVGAGLLQGLPTGQQSDSAPFADTPVDGGGDATGDEGGEAAGGGLEGEDAEQSQVRPQEDTREAPAPEAQEAPPPGDAADFPVVLDSEASLADERVVRERHRGLPEVEGLLGLPRAEAREAARTARAAVVAASSFRSGVRPDACLAEAARVPSLTPGPRVVARVETVAYAGEPALAYVVVTASPETDALNRVASWIVAPGSCATRALVDVSP